MYLCALLLELVYPSLHIGKLALELLDLLLIGPNRLVESLGEQVWQLHRRVGAHIACRRYRLGPDGHCAVASAGRSCVVLLGLLWARVHGFGLLGG